MEFCHRYFTLSTLTHEDIILHGINTLFYLTDAPTVACDAHLRAITDLCGLIQRWDDPAHASPALPQPINQISHSCTMELYKTWKTAPFLPTPIVATKNSLSQPTSKGAYPISVCAVSKSAHTSGNIADSVGVNIVSKVAYYILAGVPPWEWQPNWTHCPTYIFASPSNVTGPAELIARSHTFTNGWPHIPWLWIRTMLLAQIYPWLVHDHDWWWNRTVPEIHATAKTSQVSTNLEWILLDCAKA